AQTEDRPFILVAEGTYAESIELYPGIAIHGGYRPGDGWARGGERSLIEAPGPVLRATDITIATPVTHVHVRADDADPGESSVAVLLVRSSGVRFEDALIEAGRGGDGEAGTMPTEPATDGADGE